MGRRCSFCAACTRKQGIFAGRPASFLVLEAESVFEAIRNRAGVLPLPVPFQCLNRVHEVSNSISQYMHEVTIQHYDKLKFILFWEGF